MTSPEPGGGNDEVIRVVYQAVADYSQLLRETRRAKAETAELKRELDGLAGDSTHRVKVTADTTQARTELARVLRDVVVTVKVTVDAAAANAELTRLLRDVTVKARIVVDAVAARAEIARTVRDTVVNVRAQVDDQAVARLRAALAGLRDLAVRVSVKVEQAALDRLRTALARMRDILVRVDLIIDTAALARLQAALARIREKITVTLDVDDTGLAGLRERLAGLSVRLDVDLDIARIEARYRALLAHLESLGPIVLTVDLDRSIFDRLRELEAQIRRLRENDTGGGSDNNAGGGGRSQSASPIPAGLAAAAGLILKIVPAIAAVIPLAAAAAGAVGVVTAAFLAAGAATAIFAVAAVGAFSKVTEAVKAYEKSGTIAAGPLGQVVAQFEALKARYSELQKATQGDVFAVFGRGLAIASTLLEKVQGLVGKTAHAIDGALAQVQAAISGAGFDQFLAFVGTQGPHAIEQLTAGLLGFGGGLGRLIMQFAPFVRSFVDGFARIGRQFDTWASGLDHNDKFQAFLAYCMAEVPKLIDLIVNLVKAAANLLVALAPIGDTFLDVANAALALVAAVPAPALTTIAVGVLAIAAAVKALQAAIAIKDGYNSFLGFLDKVGARGAGAKAKLGALLDIAGKASVFAAAFLALNGPLDQESDAQKDAAASTVKHTEALAGLGEQINKSKGDVTLDTRLATYQALQQQTVQTHVLDANDPRNNKASSGSDTDNNGDRRLVQMDLPTAAKYAGVDLHDLTSGATGKDQAAYQRALDQFDKYIAARKAKLKALAQDPNATKQQKSQAQADLDIGQRARDNYAKLAGAEGEVAKQTKAAADEQQRQAEALGDAADAASAAANQYATAAEAATAVKKALQVDFNSDASTSAYNNAVTAGDAYRQAVQAQQDDETNLARAQVAARRAQEDLTAARVAAVARIHDVQRALRDMTLDERQAKLSVKQADENLAKLVANGGSADEIEQAKIDAERAHNALNDLEQDKGPKKKSLEKELAAGVSGQRALQDAVQNNKDAQTALGRAGQSVIDSTKRVVAAKLAYQQAAGALGLTTGQLEKLRTKMEQLKSKTVNVTVNTKNADAALAKLLQGEYALQLLAAHPDWGLDKAMAEAAKQIPSLAAAAKTPAPAAGQSDANTGVHRPGAQLGNATGGPAGFPDAPTPPGAVYGPGTGTSDDVAAYLPVAGAARLSRGEHIVTDAEVRNAPGGHQYLEAFRAGLRAGRPWGPAAPPRLAAGGAALRPWSAVLPVFRLPPLPVTVPGYAAGGATTAARQIVQHVDRSVSVHVGTINNPVAETAGTSLYRQVRRAVDGEVF